MIECRVGCVAALLMACAVGGVRAATIELEVDATELSRNLARAVMRIETPGEVREGGGAMDLRYVIWSPGNHTPSGPIENLVDLEVRDCRGGRLSWRRDPAMMERFSVDVPAGCGRVEVSLSYIASQPNNNSRSTDTYGRSNLGVLNWNTVLLYPSAAELTNQTISVKASLVLPSEWAYATALESVGTEGERFGTLREMDAGRAVNFVVFEEVPLAELVDSPVIMGKFLKTYTLYPLGFEGTAAHSVSVVAPEAKYTEIPEWMLADLSEMVRQHFRVFGKEGHAAFPRSHYEFLIVADSSVGFAVEHGESTLTAVGTKAFSEAKQDEPGEKPVKGGGGELTVLAHEYFHAWCGKLAAPEGLVREDFSSPARTELLWVYEGLTTYYEDVLACRSGMTTFEEFKEGILSSAVTLGLRSGRLWRSVEDTAVSARLLRNRGLYWYDRRRGQEYYSEGAMFWMEADALIRCATEGAKSLDDFCRELFDVPVRPVGAQATYTRGDVVRVLAGLSPGTDWDGLIRSRIEEPAGSLDMQPVVRLMGWEMQFADEPTAEQKKLQSDEEGVNLRTSLGLRVSKEAEIVDIVPGGPADEAGLAYGMKVMAVEGWEYSKERLKEAVKETARTKGVEFVVSFGGRVETRRVEYEGGARVPRLVRVEGERDWLSEVVKGR
jgi:predicted metalloprotease with PDZ domain